MGIEIEYPLGYASSGDSQFRDTGSLFPSILVTCPNHVSPLFLALSISVIYCPSSFLVTSFRILSFLDLPSILRSRGGDLGGDWGDGPPCIGPPTNILRSSVVG